MVCEISKMFTLFSARYVHTFAMIPTVSLPTTVIIVFFIISLPFSYTAINCDGSSLFAICIGKSSALYGLSPMVISAQTVARASAS